MTACEVSPLPLHGGIDENGVFVLPKPSELPGRCDEVNLPESLRIFGILVGFV